MTIARAGTHCPTGHWPSEAAADSLSLDFEARHRRRIRMTTDGGEDILLDLPKTVAMADEDGLQLDDGRWLRVRAALEPVVEVGHVDPAQLMRIALYLGNRHLPTQVLRSALRIRPDHVIELMLQGFGAALVRLQTPFQPEAGAYSARGEDHHHHGNHSHHHE